MQSLDNLLFLRSDWLFTQDLACSSYRLSSVFKFRNILNKPKPKVEPPPPAPADTTATKEESMDTPSDKTSDANANAEAKPEEAKVNGDKIPDMDVD